MARVEIPVERITRSGLDIGVGETTPDAVDGAMFQNDGRTILLARNTGTSAHTLTIITPKVEAGLAVNDLTVSVNAGQTLLIGPFPTELFNQTSGADVGKVYVNADGTQTEMRYKAIRL